MRRYLWRLGALAALALLVISCAAPTAAPATGGAEQPDRDLAHEARPLLDRLEDEGDGRREDRPRRDRGELAARRRDRAADGGVPSVEALVGRRAQRTGVEGRPVCRVVGLLPDDDRVLAGLEDARPVGLVGEGVGQRGHLGRPVGSRRLGRDLDLHDRAGVRAVAGQDR